jgi:predicted transcriptional regulator
MARREVSMTVSDICQKIQAKFLCGDGAKEFRGVYVGDLLSRAMSHIECDNLWVTIMSNVNIVAVCALADPACIVLSENVQPDPEALSRAEQQGVNVLSTSLDTFGACAKIAAII